MIFKAPTLEGDDPFRYWVFDDFLEESYAATLADSFPEVSDPCLLKYSNPLEGKFLLNDWNCMSNAIYAAIEKFFSRSVSESLSMLTGYQDLVFDPGLHGAGLFMQTKDGHLNPHVDYQIHPKVKYQRRLSILLYLSPDYRTEYGGRLCLYQGTKEAPDLDMGAKVILEPLFNRLVIFETTDRSWHAVEQINSSCPESFVRKAIGLFALTVSADGDLPQRARYAPTADQKNDESLQDFIKKRSDPKCKNTFIY